MLYKLAFFVIFQFNYCFIETEHGDRHTFAHRLIWPNGFIFKKKTFVFPHCHKPYFGPLLLSVLVYSRMWAIFIQQLKSYLYRLGFTKVKICILLSKFSTTLAFTTNEKTAVISKQPGPLSYKVFQSARCTDLSARCWRSWRTVKFNCIVR